MKTNGVNRFILWLAALIIGLSIIFIVLWMNQEELHLYLNKSQPHKAYAESILYSWEMSAVESKQDQLLKVLEDLQVTILYQEFSGKFFSKEDSTFISQMKDQGVEVFHLCGTPQWAFEKQAESMLLEIDKVLIFNRNAAESIQGIVFDVEPYIKVDYTIDDLNQYVSNLKKAYAYAQSNHLYMVAVIPYWLERQGDHLLPDIIENGCDEVSVMNYYISKTTEHIAEELELAGKCDKWINSVYEMNLDQDGTFESIGKVQQDFEKMYDQYRYEKLRIAYHHFGDLSLEGAEKRAVSK